MEEKTIFSFISYFMILMFFAFTYAILTVNDVDEYAETVEGLTIDNRISIDELYSEIERLKAEVKELSYDSHSH